MARLLFLSIALIALSTCGEKNRDKNLRSIGAPTGGADSVTTLVALSLNEQSLLLLDKAADFCQLQVLSVDGETLSREGEPRRYQIPAELKDVRLEVKGVSFGLKEFRLALMTELGEILAEGTFRHFVGPGEQSVGSPVRLKIRPLKERRPDVPVDIQLFLQRAATKNIAEVTYADVKPLLDGNDRHYCVKCHQPDNMRGGLNFASFPFTTTKPQNYPSQEAIVKAMLVRLRDGADPMPPKYPDNLGVPSFPAAQVGVIQAWLDGGLKVSPSSDIPIDGMVKRVEAVAQLEGKAFQVVSPLNRVEATRFFKGTLPALIERQKFGLQINVYGESDKLIGSQKMEPMTIEQNSAVKQDVQLSVTEPKISVAIEITQ